MLLARPKMPDPNARRTPRCALVCQIKVSAVLLVAHRTVDFIVVGLVAWKDDDGNSSLRAVELFFVDD